MALSNDLISQFVKITKDEKKPVKETTAYGEVTNVEYVGDKITNVRVRLDGASEDTPIASTADVIVGDRVIVMIKNHTAVITGNITSPSARTEVVRKVVTTVTEMDDIVADKVSTEDLAAEQARIKALETDNVVVHQKLEATEADISALEADSLEVHQTLRANDADIKYLKANILGADQVEATFATIEMLEAAEADIDELEAAQAELESATVQELEAQKADIQELNAKKLSATDIEGKYANIDFSNISKATMQWFYANSGLIEDVVVGDGHITGKLVGVTIIGDLIEGGTVKADKLVIKGTDGLYYKLNTDGVKTEAEQTEYNSINGSVILAKSITATKISVDDLVAFDATIGGFNITDNSLYSGVKSTVNNTTRGIYLDSEGQMAVGDASNFIKYYKDTNGAYKLEISADSLTFGSSKKSIETAINDVKTTADNAQSTANATETRVTEAEALLEVLSESISMLVTDGNGASLMTQTENGWTFSTGDIQALVNRTSEELNDLTNAVGDVNHTVDILQQAVDDLGTIAEYVNIGTYEDEPCIELGEGDSDFKLRITNTRMMFTEGSSVLAYFNNQSLHIKKAVVEEELQQGGFVWKARSNGNLGLMWKGGTN
jgi:hypothetical protein